MVTPRGRDLPPVDEAKLNRFAAEAEQPRKAKPDLPAWKIRNKEPKEVPFNFRASKSQSRMLREWAEEEDISLQKLLERIILPILEEERGEKS